jgi:hypothetical protein
MGGGPQFTYTLKSKAMTLNQFYEFCSNLGLPHSRYDSYRIVDNDFYQSHHIKDRDNNIAYNFWFDKPCYLLKGGEVTISRYDGNMPHERDRLKNVWRGSDLKQFANFVNELFEN